MRQLVIGCRFIAHSYQGLRQDAAQRDELDWPPAPARLHQALIAVALSGRPAELRESYASQALEALRWLETLPPPEIVATRLVWDEVTGRRPQIALPHNSPSKKRGLVHHELYLAPARRAVAEEGAPLEVCYVWFSQEATFRSIAEKHFTALTELAAQLRYFGRGEDRVEATVMATLRDAIAELPAHFAIWRPVEHSGDVELYRSRPRSTEQLESEFKVAHHRPGRIAKTPARRFFVRQGYETEVAQGLRPVHVAIFQLFSDSDNPDEAPLACDPENAHRWRSPIREAAIRIAEDSNRWDDPPLAYELITGHRQDEQGITQQPHLAFIPLPSLSAHGKADGRVRRFALIGYAVPDLAERASAIYRVLAASLEGEEIIIKNGRTKRRLRTVEDPAKDKVWLKYSSSSRLWLSSTPVAIARGFKVPTYSPDGIRALSSNERHICRLREWTALVRDSLRHIRLPEDLVASCQITFSSSPLLTSTPRTDQYRVKGEQAVLVHAKFEFAERVRGPLLVGDRRYKGFGLFFPSDAVGADAYRTVEI